MYEVTRGEGCGLACLRFLLRRHGWAASQAPLEKYERARLSLSDLVEACDAMGLRGSLLYCERFTSIDFYPAIAHLSRGHFIALFIANSSLRIFDPARGEYDRFHDDEIGQLSGGYLALDLK